jgi:hypothetical protein
VTANKFFSLAAMCSGVEPEHSGCGSMFKIWLSYLLQLHHFITNDKFMLPSCSFVWHD